MNLVYFLLLLCRHLLLLCRNFLNLASAPHFTAQIFTSAPRLLPDPASPTFSSARLPPLRSLSPDAVGATPRAARPRRSPALGAAVPSLLLLHAPLPPETRREQGGRVLLAGVVPSTTPLPSSAPRPRSPRRCRAVRDASRDCVAASAVPLRSPFWLTCYALCRSRRVPEGRPAQLRPQP